MYTKIITVIILVGFGVFIGYFLQLETLEAPSETQESNVATDAETNNEATTTAESDNEGAKAPITIEASALTADQKALLGKLGIDTDGITVTQEMIVCAEAKLGKERLDEIYAGATPTFLEGVSLLPCYK